jgi:large subunit ribosomal protein L18
MPSNAQQVRHRRLRRHRTIRKKVVGTPERPRLNIFRSSANMYLQIIDDSRGHTLVAASTMEPSTSAGTKTEQARKAGELIAQRAKEAGINQVVFDRGGFLYHGRVKAVADGARAGGLEF